MINRLRKAERESEKLVKLVMAFEKCDARSKLECQAYHDWIEGTLKFELQNWREATVCLTKARYTTHPLHSRLDKGNLFF